MPQVTATDVIFVLTQLGINADNADQAAHDPLISWDKEQLRYCLAFIRQCEADPAIKDPPALLWYRLSTNHQVPLPPGVKPTLTLLTEDNPGPALCPWCKEDMAVCQGMHGWAAQYRGMTAAEIYTAEHPPRRTRKGRNTT